jgi:hypothetical protein
MNRLMGMCLVLTLAACSGSTNGDGGTTTGGGTTGGATTGGTGGTTTGGTSGNSVTACTNWCDVYAACNSYPTSYCSSLCSDPSLSSPQGCRDPAGYFNCLAALPCGGITDAGSAGVTTCAEAHCI